MLSAIQFNREFSIHAIEIDDESINRDLSPKFEPSELSIAKFGPKELLGICCVVAQNASEATQTPAWMTVRSHLKNRCRTLTPPLSRRVLRARER